VTVDNQLPDGSNAGTEAPNGDIIGYSDIPTNGALWAGLAEKAYAELNTHSYLALNVASNSKVPLAEITGRSVWAEDFYTTFWGVNCTGSTTAV
jgi:hypothetical protein